MEETIDSLKQELASAKRDLAEARVVIDFYFESTGGEDDSFTEVFAGQSTFYPIGLRAKEYNDNLREKDKTKFECKEKAKPCTATY